MNTKVCYSYDEDRVYAGKILAFEDPLTPGSFPLPANATYSVPPELEPPYVAVWNGSAWVQTEDHRKHLDETGTPAGGTPYWMPSEGDNYQSEPRYMKELGPLPEGAVTERPAKAEAEMQKEQLEETIRESESLLNSTDYRVIKFMDSYIQSHPEIKADFDAEYPTTLQDRQDARDAINGAQASAQEAGISLD